MPIPATFIQRSIGSPSHSSQTKRNKRYPNWKGKSKTVTVGEMILCMLLLLLLSRFSRVLLCATPQTAAHQAPPSLGFSRQEHWSGLPFPSPMHESEK